MRTIGLDLRHAARALRHSPGLVLVAAVSLGLGMSVNTTLFSSLKAILFEEPTASAPGRLVRLWIGGANSISYLNFRDIRRQGILGDIAGSQLAFFSTRLGEDAERSMGEIVTANYFDVLGVHAALGRMFAPEEAEPSRDPRVVVLSYGYWQRHFARDTAAIGSLVRINGQPFTVAGVLPQGFRSVEVFPLAPEIYVPLGPAVAENLQKRDGFRLGMLGRLRDGTARRQIQAALAAAAGQLEREYPRENQGFAQAGARVFGISAAERLREAQAIGPVMALTGLLLALSGTVLLIACGNVAGLLLARSANRRREIAVRLALGASRGQIVQQLMAESLLLALVGVGCGRLLNLWTMDLLGNLKLPIPLPVPIEWRPDFGFGLLPFELLLAAGTMLLCGLAPALEASRVSLVSALKGESPRYLARRFTRRNLRVIAQVASSMLLLVLASLTLRGLGRVVHLSPGFEADRILNAEVNLDGSRFKRARGLAYVDEAIRRIGSLPGVESAAAAAVVVPARFMWIGTSIRVEGRPETRAPQAKLNAVTPGYFRTMGIALLRGRDFQASDTAAAPRVAVVGETFVKRFFPDSDAVGRHVRTTENQVLEIVGVVRDSAYGALGEAPQPLLYQPMAQEYGMGLVLHVRTAGPPQGLAAAVKRELSAIGADVPIRVAAMRDTIDLSLVTNRGVAAGMGVMGALGMLLALIGLYGVISHDVSRRTSEIGIRVALGAAPKVVLGNVLKDGLFLVGWGVAAGLAAALMFIPPVAALLGTGTGLDPLSLLGPALLLLAAGGLASYIPARRATQVDPLTALRFE